MSCSATLDVLAEREPKDGQPELIDQPLELHIGYSQSTSVYFRLSITVNDGVSDASVMLQILPDNLALLRSKLCKWEEFSSTRPNDACQRLGGPCDLTCLRFHLRSPSGAQIVVPKDYTDFKTPGSAARHAVHLFASLVASSSFCVYWPRPKMARAWLNQFCRAVEQFPMLKRDDLRHYHRKTDPKRLYGGKGGMVLVPDDYKDGSCTDGDRSRSTTPATNDSNGSTVDFDSVPRSEGLPPSYGECLAELVKPRATSDDKANAVESPCVDHAPPDYDGTELHRSVPNASKRPRQCANEDALLCPRPKKVSSTTPSTTAPTSNAQCLDAKPRLESEDAGIDVCTVFRELTSRLDNQQQQIKQLLHEQSEQQMSQEHQLKTLQDQIGNLRRQNAELKRRNSELENICAELTNRQETADEERESIWLDISELQEVTGEHGNQLADNPKLAEDLALFIWGDDFQGHVSESMKEHLDDLVKEYLERICAGDLIKLLRECVQKKVASQMDEMKARVCETFK